MCKVESLTVYCNDGRLMMHRNATFLMQIAVLPDVMVAREIMDINAIIGRIEENA